MTKTSRTQIHHFTHRIVAAAHVRGLDLVTIAQIVFFQIGN